MIIAIDGPAGAGKSTTARAVAERLHYAYIDTGAMYRAIALATLESDLQVGRDDAAIIQLAANLPLRFADNGRRIFIEHREVSALIRTARVSERAAAVSALSPLREVMVAQQRRLGREGEATQRGAVLEGRDIQTVVFPKAEVKIFLTAGAQTRATRRLAQLAETRSTGGLGDDATQISVAEVAQAIDERDQSDRARTSSPLRAATDAVHIATDSLTPDEVASQIVALAEAVAEASS